MDKIILKDFALKYWKHLAILVLALLLFNQCNKSSGLIQSAKSHKQKANEYLAEAKAIKQNLNNEIAVYKSEINRLNSINVKNEKKLSDLSKITKAKISLVTHYNSADIKNYFVDRYNAPNDVISSQNGTILKDMIGKLVISDLVVGEGAKAEVKILREIVVTEKQKFETADQMVDSLHLGLEAVSNAYEKANAEKDKALSKTEKAFRHERNKKNFWKLTTIATVLGGGYLLLK